MHGQNHIKLVVTYFPSQQMKQDTRLAWSLSALSAVQRTIAGEGCAVAVMQHATHFHLGVIIPVIITILRST